MKQFQFSLKKILSYKEQVQSLEKNKLAQLTLKKNQLEEQIVQLKLESNRLSAELLNAANVGISMMLVNNYNYQLQNNRMYLKQLGNDLNNAIFSVEKQLKIVMAATQDVEGLEKLKEKQYQEYLYEDGKEQELIVSEFVSSKIIREQNSV